MRFFLPLLACISLCTASFAESLQDKPFEWENKNRVNTLGHDGYLKLFVYYCANCPSAGKMMKNNMKALHDQIEQEKLRCHWCLSHLIATQINSVLTQNR